MVTTTNQDIHDIMGTYAPGCGKEVLVNSWEFIDHLNATFESGGYKELWHTLRFIMGEGTESGVNSVILADGGEFYPSKGV